MSAEIINLSDTTPPAPTGKVNAKWQKGDQSGVDPTTGLAIFPVSAYVDIGAGLTPVDEVPTGVGTVTITLSHEPVAATLDFSVNGVGQIPSVDYTIALAVITMTVSTVATDKLLARYSY